MAKVIDFMLCTFYLTHTHTHTPFPLPEFLSGDLAQDKSESFCEDLTSPTSQGPTELLSDHDLCSQIHTKTSVKAQAVWTTLPPPVSSRKLCLQNVTTGGNSQHGNFVDKTLKS